MDGKQMPSVVPVGQSAASSRLLTDAVSQPVIVTEPALPPTPKAQARTASTSAKTAKKLSTLYDQVGMSLALVLALLIAGALWAAGAYFTLQFLASMGLVIAAAGWVAWLVPAAITASELWLWPHTGTRWQQVVFFLLVLAFDVGSSWAGLVAWGAGRHIPLFTGFTLPVDGWSLHVTALVVGMLFAFLPEKLGRWAISDLWRLWH